MSKLTFGKAVAIRRAEYGMSQKELAEKAGIDPSFISRIESSDRDVTLKVANRIALAFGLDVSELFSTKVVSELFP